MNYLNIFFAFLAFLFWLALIMVYKREALRDWYQNRFVPDPIPQEGEAGEDASLEGDEVLLPFDYEVPQSKLFEKPPIDLFYENNVYKIFALNSVKKVDKLLIFMPDYGLMQRWNMHQYMNQFLKKIENLQMVSLVFIPQNQAIEEMSTYEFHCQKALARAHEWLADYDRRMLKNNGLKLFFWGNSIEFYRIILKESQIIGYHYESALALPSTLEADYGKILALQEKNKIDARLYLEYDPRIEKERRFYQDVFCVIMAQRKMAQREVVCCGDDYCLLPLCYQHSEGNFEEVPHHLEYLDIFIEFYGEPRMIFQKYLQKRRYQRDVIIHIIKRVFEKGYFHLTSLALISQRVKDAEIIAFMIEKDSAYLRNMVKILVEKGYQEKLLFLIEALHLPYLAHQKGIEHRKAEDQEEAHSNGPL